MNRLFAFLFLLFSAGVTLAQTVECQVLDSINNVVLLTTDYMPYCQKALLKSKNSVHNSLSLNYYINNRDSYYILCLPVVTKEKLEIRKGSKLKLTIQLPRDTVRLSCSSTFVSKDSIVEEGETYWVTYPKYHCSEKTLQQLIDRKVSCIVQDIAKGKSIRFHEDDFSRWRFSKTLSNYHKALSKQKTRSANSDMFFNNGRLEYLKEDTIVKTDKRIKFSEDWLY